MTDPNVQPDRVAPTTALDPGVAPEGLRLVSDANRPATSVIAAGRSGRGGLHDIVRRFRRNWPAMVGLGALAVIVLLAVGGPVLPTA